MGSFFVLKKVKSYYANLKHYKAYDNITRQHDITNFATNLGISYCKLQVKTHFFYRKIQ